MAYNIWSGTPQQSKLGKIGCGVALIALMLIVLLFALWPEPAAVPTGQKELPKATIRDAGLYPPALNLELDFGSARSGLVIGAAGDEIAALGAKMISGPQPVTDSVSYINFTVLGGAGPDATVGRKIAFLSFNTDTMRALAREGANGGRFLNSAKEVNAWYPANADVVDDYCVADSPLCDKLKK